MAKPDFNNENIEAKINEIKAMEGSEQESEIDSIRNDLKAYIRNNFSLTNDQDKKLDNLTEAGSDELAHGIALALENGWELTIENNPDLPDGQINQSVAQTYNPQTSSYSVTKTVSWSWC